jgi:hypothetical protein
MRNQTKRLFVYLWASSLFITSIMQFAQAKQEVSLESSDVTQLSQAQIDQILAPIALYPDTLLSHILVASTYPLEIIQAARWRAVNEDLNEQQALNAVEDKNWDPSVQALVPFNDLLQKLSEDLNWLQSLGSAFLVNEQQILTSVQNLRQRAYEQGNLADNDYVDVEQKEGAFIIETVRKEVVYVPYYDTRVIYGNWRWQNYQPYYWHRPSHSVFNAGSYWSIGFDIRPSFYFGGFHWRNRHVVANYHYRNHADRHWSNSYNRHQVVRVKEYPRWRHNQQHRRGAQHRVNGQRIIRNIDGGIKAKGYRQIDKQRVLNVDNYPKKHAKKYNKNKAIRVKQVLDRQQQTALQTKTLKISRSTSNKQRAITQSKNQQRRALNNELRPQNTVKFESKQPRSRQLQKSLSLKSRADKKTRYPINTQNNASAYRSHDKSSSNSNNKSINRSNNQNNNYRISSNKQNKSKPANVSRQNNITRNQSKIQQR